MKPLLHTILFSLFTVTSNAQAPVAYDLEPGIGNSYPHQPTGYKNSIVTYAKYAGQAGSQLTSIDIATGTKTVYPFTITSGGAFIERFAKIGSDLYFAGCPTAVVPLAGNTIEELWKYDDNGNHQLVTDLSGYRGTTCLTNPQVSYLTPLNGKLYFSANSYLSLTMPTQLYEYNPATGNTKKCTSVSGAQVYDVQQLVAFKNKIYFVGNTPATGTEMWQYDPATGVASLLADINNGDRSSYPWIPVVIGNSLYFSATTTGNPTIDDVRGTELYEYDGTNPVKRITDLDPGPGSGVSGLHNIIGYNGEVYFGGYDGSTTGLYKYNQSSGAITPIYTGFHTPGGDTTGSLAGGVSWLAIHNNELFFSAGSIAYGIDLWKYDGINPPVPVLDMMPGFVSGEISFPTSYDNELYFCAKDNVHGAEIYRYMGQTTGVMDITRSSQQIKVYPNPMESVVHFNINNSVDAHISIYDALGKIMCQQTTNKPTSITTGNFTPGTYYYTIRSSNGTTLQSGKLLKQ